MRPDIWKRDTYLISWECCEHILGYSFPNLVFEQISLIDKVGA